MEDIPRFFKSNLKIFHILFIYINSSFFLIRFLNDEKIKNICKKTQIPLSPIKLLINILNFFDL